MYKISSKQNEQKRILNMQQNGTSDKHINCDRAVFLAENVS